MQRGAKMGPPPPPDHFLPPLWQIGGVTNEAPPSLLLRLLRSTIRPYTEAERERNGTVLLLEIPTAVRVSPLFFPPPIFWRCSNRRSLISRKLPSDNSGKRKKPKEELFFSLFFVFRSLHQSEEKGTLLLFIKDREMILPKFSPLFRKREDDHHLLP